MTKLSAIAVDTARKSLTVALQSLQDPGVAAEIAKAMQTSESTVSRLKNEHMPALIEMLAHAGVKLVPVSSVEVDMERLKALALLASAGLSTPELLVGAVVGGWK